MSRGHLLMITNALLNRIKFLLLGCCVLVSFSALADAPVRIGVLAYRPKPQTLEQWQALSKVLHQAIPEREFIVEALNYDELEAGVDSSQLDFVLTNPGHYVHISYQHGFSAPLATLLRHEDGGSQDKFGGVIFAKAERLDLNALGDLRGKKNRRYQSRLPGRLSNASLRSRPSRHRHSQGIPIGHHRYAARCGNGSGIVRTCRYRLCPHRSSGGFGQKWQARSAANQNPQRSTLY